MISNLSSKLTSLLIDQREVNESERNLYEYGFFILLSNIFILTVILITGFLCKIPVQSLLFFVTFTLARQYAGGFHASSELHCLLLSTFLMISSVVSISTLGSADSQLIVTIILDVIGTLIILWLSPMDTEEKPLTKEEVNRFRKASQIIVLILNVCFILTLVFKLKIVFVPISVGIFLEGVLLLMGRFKFVSPF